MKTSRLSTITPCPACGHRLDAATAGPQNARATPSPGDVTVCIDCATVLIFERAPGGGLKPRLPTPAEYAEVDRNPELTRIRTAIIALRRRRD